MLDAPSGLTSFQADLAGVSISPLIILRTALASSSSSASIASIKAAMALIFKISGTSSSGLLSGVRVQGQIEARRSMTEAADRSVIREWRASSSRRMAWRVATASNGLRGWPGRAGSRRAALKAGDRLVTKAGRPEDLANAAFELGGTTERVDLVGLGHRHELATLVKQAVDEGDRTTLGGSVDDRVSLAGGVGHLQAPFVVGSFLCLNNPIISHWVPNVKGTQWDFFGLTLRPLGSMLQER